MTTKTAKERTLLERRIRQFYDLLNAQKFARCHEMIDPQVRSRAASVTLLQYQRSLRDFLDAAGQIDIERIHVELHLGERTKLYSDRDFAVGETTWKDGAGQSHVFQERWVRAGRTWYTRTTGLIPPVLEKASSAAGKTTRAREVVRT